MRELEELLHKERLAREEAEELAKRLEESQTTHMNGSALPGEIDLSDEATEIAEKEAAPETVALEAAEEEPSAADAAQETATALQARIDVMENQMRDMKEQMEEWKQRCEVAESERDADRKTLAEMVVQLRAEEALREAAEKRARSRSRKRNSEVGETVPGKANVSSEDSAEAEEAEAVEPATNDAASDAPTLSRANTITPTSPQKGALAQEQHLHAGLPYASMLGVVLFGVGLMAYLNGWQAQPPRAEQ
ncbi:hypothetical protein NM208_g16658 [Fusarium decemcellulare]|uniref:Uncharacterized protein n=1 Tax=Fusarium decemcellulare TaxID=57161 RepID=A0ACC1RC85_9HYPO|nr:hypothetical protein NM208_g16658 [Fusarium decemcellulare]